MLRKNGKNGKLSVKNSLHIDNSKITQDEKIPKLFIFSSFTRIILFSIFLITTMIVVAWISIIKLQEEAIEISVPDLKDRNIVKAIELLQEKNLQFYVIAIKEKKKPINQIIKQWPKAGSLVKEERVIKIWMNTRDSLTKIPNFEGMKIDKALNFIN